LSDTKYIRLGNCLRIQGKITAETTR
jgi:hypothetical protein